MMTTRELMAIADIRTRYIAVLEFRNFSCGAWMLYSLPPCDTREQAIEAGMAEAVRLEDMGREVRRVSIETTRGEFVPE